MSQLAARVGAELRLAGSDPVVTDVVHDSRDAAPGALFVALSGSSFDGHDYAADVMQAGAVGVCVERPLGLGPEMIVEDTRAVLGHLAAEVHGHPSRSLSLIGVTGTNGKTTVTHYLHSLFTHVGKRPGLIGTIGSRIGGRQIESDLTTPEASDLQRLLREMVAEGVSHVAMEVSSHALSLGRVEGAAFDVAAFTNLSQDHLDFHGDMASYRRAKESLFFDHDVTHRVVNIDDPSGQELAARLNEVTRVGAEGDVRYDIRSTDPDGNVVEIRSDWGEADVLIPVQGTFNVSNAVLSLACSVVSGLEFGDAIEALAVLEPVPGRFETLAFGDAPIVIVDYAHTPAGIESAIQAARQMGSGRVIALVGAGGDRDRTKRPLMGKAIGSADVVIVTTDNPRSEDPASIASDVSSGVDGPHRVVLDRRDAIEAAIQEADADDIVLILGRGHESHQDLGAGERVPFRDADMAKALLDMRTDGPSRGGSQT